MYTTDFDNGYQEFEIEIDFDYEPYEAMTRHYPGNSESVIINDVRVAETQAELCLLKGVEDELAEKVMEWIHDEQDYAEYGYMME